MIESRILVTGGNGRLGAAVLHALGERGVAGTRRPELANDAVLINADGEVAPGSLAGIAAVINCVGLVTGIPAEIEQANVTYPKALAQSARAAGVRRFVHVSSFSIFGRTEYIDASTRSAPSGVYSRSKLAAEEALVALDNADFHVLPLRLPFIFSAEEPALLGRLVAMMLRARALPTLASKPSRRSMITYAGAADSLIRLALVSEPPSGALAAADREPLKLLTIARLIGERLNRRIVRVPVPTMAVGIAAMAFPTVVDRLFGSSVLATSANFAADMDTHRVEAELIRYLDNVAVRLSAGHRHGSR